MKLNAYTITRIAVPVLLVAGFILYHVFDKPYPYGQPVRWPGIVAWVLAALLALGYHAQNKKRPRAVLGAATIVFILAILSYLYALYGASGFDGIGWAVFVSLPLAGLAVLLFFASLYIGRPK